LVDGWMFLGYKPPVQNVKNITVLTAFEDNYIYLVESSPGRCFVVDPGEAEPVFDALENRVGTAPTLTHILTTHHHADHTGGVAALKQRTGCKVISPDAKRIAGLDRLVQDGELIKLGDLHIRCIATPGHTTTSMCYFVTGGSLGSGVLFTGDTLFVCGCGRLFECSGQTMFESLQKLAALPDKTLVYPGHDYTEENVRFAITLEPDNKPLQKKLSEVQTQNQRGHGPPYKVGSMLGEEKRINPFLRAKDWQAFTSLRRKKDLF